MALKLAPVGMVALAAAAILSLPGHASADEKAKLMVKYETKSACTVHLNYPKEGVVGDRTFTVPAGKSIIWRYNVNANWALISYPSQAHETFPWWGFTTRDCIGKSVKQKGYPAGQSVPDKILEGSSRVAQSGWRPVHFTMPPATVVAQHKRVNRNATLRDDANFVIGNVPEGWHVDVTNITRSKGHWVEVYVPNAKRWGYIERATLG